MAVCFAKRPCREVPCYGAMPAGGGTQTEANSCDSVASWSPLDTRHAEAPAVRSSKAVAGSVMCVPGHTVATEYGLFRWSAPAAGEIHLGRVQGISGSPRFLPQGEPIPGHGNDAGAQSTSKNVCGVDSGP